MSKSKYIKIEEVQVLKNRLLLSKISCSRSLERYFQSNLFWVKYDVDIHEVDASILGIPILFNIIAVAWVTGADIYIKELDNSFLTALNRIKAILQRWFPRFPFSTNIHVENIVFNKVDSHIYGLLFSGGLDSTTSYIQHRNKKPNLIMIWGADIPLDRNDFWRKIKTLYKKFAERADVKINFLKSNIQEFLNVYRLDIEFSRYLEGASWWNAVQHGQFSLGICAPLTITNNIGILLHASSFTGNYKYPQFSHPLIESKLSWAGIKIIHDGWELSRQEKIGQVLKNYLMNNKFNFPIRVCFSQYRGLNCNKCEKCYRTITGLVLENIDPNKYGFHISSDFFAFLKRYLLETKILVSHENMNFLWNDIKSHIPENFSHNLHHSKEFFNWFREFDISLRKNRSVNPFWFLFRIYCKFPIRLQTLLKRLEHSFESVRLDFSIV